MIMKLIRVVPVLLAAATSVRAAPAPAPAPVPKPTPAPEPTPIQQSWPLLLRDGWPAAAAAAAAPAPTVLTADTMQTQARRGLGDVVSDAKSLGSAVESKISTFVGSSLLEFPHGFPIGSAVKSALDISSGVLDAQPTRVLNLPAYANWTDQGWNVRIRGNVYKMPDISQDKIDDLADVFLVGTSVKDLGDDEKNQARNLTREIYVVRQSHENVTIRFSLDRSNSSSRGGPYVPAQGGAQDVLLPYETNAEGDFDFFVPLRNTSSSSSSSSSRMMKGTAGHYMMPGNATNKVQTLEMEVKGTDTGNATAYLVPPRGVTIVSDIDDILRVTKIYKPKEGLLNTFARPFTPWMNMPDIYANWSSSSSSPSSSDSAAALHFHYLTTTPEQVTQPYMDFILATYPAGSFDTRPLNFSNAKETFSVRRYLLDKLLRSFPHRTFVLVADTSNPDIMKAYPAVYKAYPGQVSCILVRNTSATDPDDRFLYNTRGFRDIPQQHYMFFTVPDDLVGIHVVNGGGCYNASVPQNVTFAVQGLSLGLDGKKKSVAMRSLETPRGGGAVVVANRVYV